MILVDGARIIDRVADALRPATRELLIASNHPDAPAWLPEARVVRDRYDARASMVGIHAALSAAADDVIVAAWDMPFLPAALFHYIVALRDDSAAVVPEGSRGPEWCAALYTQRALPALEQLIAAERFALSGLMAALPSVRVIDVATVARFGEPSRIFTNINSISDSASQAAN